MFYSRPNSQLRGSLRYGNKKLTGHLVRVAGNLGRDAAGRAGGEKVIAPIYQLARPASLPSIYLSESERERSKCQNGWLAQRKGENTKCKHIRAHCVWKEIPGGCKHEEPLHDPFL